MPKISLSRFRNQKRIIAKRLPITSQSPDSSLKDRKIVIYFYNKWPSQAGLKTPLKKEQKCEKLEESAFKILVFLVIIEFSECQDLLASLISWFAGLKAFFEYALQHLFLCILRAKNWYAYCPLTSMCFPNRERFLGFFDSSFS